MNTNELIKLLVCPVCHGPLRPIGQAERPGGLACDACRLRYPVRNGIPVMLEEEAIPLEDSAS